VRVLVATELRLMLRQKIPNSDTVRRAYVYGQMRSWQMFQVLTKHSCTFLSTGRERQPWPHRYCRRTNFAVFELITLQSFCYERFRYLVGYVAH
jgi:hypothetical protein